MSRDHITKCADLRQTRPKKRKKLTRRNQFIEEEAEVDEDEDEEEDENDDFADEVHPDDLLEATQADLDDRHHRELDNRRQAEQNLDAEEVARQMDEKYRRREMMSARRAATSAVPTAMPTTDDPSIWVLKCRPGKEREVIMSIMKRIDERLRYGRPCHVYSAFERGGSMSGYIYVEADAKQDMMAIAEGVIHLFLGTQPLSIDVNERSDLLRKRKRTPLEAGKFVRMLRGVYKGDLAKVNEVFENGTECTVQLVPRIDYGMDQDANAAEGAKRKRPAFGRITERPPQKLFSETEAKKRHLKAYMGNTPNQKAYTYKNKHYEGGFLIEEVKVNAVSAENVNPRMEELQFFATPATDGSDGMDLVAVQAAQKAGQSGSSFVTGDTVEVYDGEQKGLRGTTVTSKGDIVTIRVTEGDLKGREIDTPVRTLRKLFRDGDHVKVIGGSKYIDEVGMITKIRDDKITLLCDSTQTEITVFSKDLKRAADSATLGPDSQFDLFDLVQIE
jgi:transcription elongation factor SPT5